MKKFVALLIALCVVFGLCIGYRAVPINDAADFDESQPAAEPVPVEPVEPADDAATTDATTDAAPAPSTDFAAIYALHEPSEVVMLVDGLDLSWADYYYFLYFQAQQMNNYFAQMSAYYGINVGWQDEYDAGVSFEQHAITAAENIVRELYGIEKYADAHGCTLTDEDKDTLQAQHESDMLTICGEGASEEDFAAALESMYMPRAVLDRLNTCNLLYVNAFEQQYGAQGELVDEAEAVKYLEDNGYLAANHILFLTTNPETGEALSDEEIAEKKAQAEELAAELQAIEDPDERLARFAELKAEFDEDTGKTNYPEGYVFTEGTMVTEFEDAVKAMADYEVSEPVLSSYGYHVIMRLPHDAQRTVQYLNTGAAVDARYLCASNAYTNEVQSVIDDVKIEYVPGFEQIVLSDYVK